MTTRPGASWRPEVTGQMLQGYLCTDAKVSISRRIMSRDRLPEKAICRTWLGYPQPVYLDVREWVCLLFEAACIRSITILAKKTSDHTFCSAMRFNSLTTACTVAVLPVPGTPEMSAGIRLQYDRRHKGNTYRYIHHYPLQPTLQLHA
jgi:hypothetical protein